MSSNEIRRSRNINSNVSLLHVWVNQSRLNSISFDCGETEKKITYKSWINAGTHTSISNSVSAFTSFLHSSKSLQIKRKILRGHTTELYDYLVVSMHNKTMKKQTDTKEARNVSQSEHKHRVLHKNTSLF